MNTEFIHAVMVMNHFVNKQCPNPRVRMVLECPDGPQYYHLANGILRDLAMVQSAAHVVPARLDNFEIAGMKVALRRPSRFGSLVNGRLVV